MARRSWFAGLGALLCLAVVASIVFFAISADGRQGSEATSNDGGAWLVNRSIGAVGHLNRRVEEVSSLVRVAEPTLAVEAYQPAGSVVAHVLTTNSLQVVDDRSLQQSASIGLPTDAVVEEFSTGLVVVGADPAGLWRVPASTLLGLQDIDDLDPLVEGAVQSFGSSWYGDVALAAGQSIQVFESDNDESKQYASPFEVVDDVAFDGRTPILRSGGEWAVLDGDNFKVFAREVAGWDRPARHTPTSDDALLGMWPGGALGELGFDGELRILSNFPGEGFVEPIAHENCNYVLSNVPTVLWVGCDGGEYQDNPLDFPAGADVRLRLVNGWVWVNDVRSGQSAVYDNELGLRSIDDWSAVLPEELDPNRDVTTASDSAIEEQVEDPDAENATRIGADEFDDDGINERPIAVDDTDDDGFETHIERPVVATVLDNDTDPDNDVLLIDSVTNLSEDSAVVTITPDATAVQVTPAPGFEGTVRFRYTITDGRGLDATALATVVVRERGGDLNRAPIPRTDVGSITAGEQLVINVLDNDTDPDGDSLVLVEATAERGTITFDPSGQVIYEPEDTSEEGEIELTYTVVDDFGESAQGIVKALIRLKDTNRPPDARNDGAVTVVGQPATINLLDNDTDDDGDELFVSEPPVLLSPLDTDVFVTNTPDGEFVFIPDEAGTYLFSYAASDDEAADAALIRVEVGESTGNRPPIAVRDDLVVPIGDSRVTYVLANDGDPDGDVVGITDFQVPSDSGLRVEPFLDVGFRVFVDEEGPTRRTFRYSITDGEAEPVSALVVVAVAGEKAENQPPFAQPDVAEVRAGATVTVPVLENDFDPEGGALRVVAVSDPEGGSAQITSNNQAVRIAVLASTTTSFEVRYDVVDDQGNGSAAVIRVQLVPPASPNRPPIARPDSARAPFETEIIVEALANDSDPDGDAIQVDVITSQPLNGTARIDPVTGQLLYTPAVGFSGTDRFGYGIVDAFGAQGRGDVLVGVLPEEEPNRDPIARDDSFSTIATGERIDLNVLINDVDPDGDQLRVVNVEDPDVGFVERTFQRTSFTYTAPTDLANNRELRLTYRISDGNGGQAEAEIVILVQATPPRPEGAPIAADDDVGPVPTGQRVSVPVVENDSDPDAPDTDLTVVVFDDDLRVDGQNVVFTAPDERAEYPYQIIDADGNADSAIIRVEVFNATPPIAIDDEAGPVRAGEVKDIPVLLNDSDPDGEPGDLRIINVEGEGVQFDETAVRITAPAVSTQYLYTIADADGLEASATISLIVTDNQAPTVQPLTVTTPFEEPIEIDVTPAVTDPDPLDVLLFSCCVSTRNGQPEVLTAGGELVVLFTPDTGFSGDAVFSYQVDDQAGHQVAGTVTVTVEPQPNRPPTVVDGVVEIQVPRPEGQPIESVVDLAALTEDPDGDELSWQITGSPGQGLTAQVVGSTVVVTAVDSSNPGSTTIGFAAIDPEQERAEGNIVVTVTEPQNEPPTAASSDRTVSAGATEIIELSELGTDTDDNEILTFTIEAASQEGITVTQTGDTTVTVNAAYNASGNSGSFQYTITDRLGESATASVGLSIGDPDEPPPTALDDDARTLQEQSVQIPVLANDIDPIGQGLEIASTGTSADGQVSISGATVTFDPTPDFFGVATFSYTVIDKAEREATANVSVEVIGFPDPPGPPVCSPESTIANVTWTTPPNNGASVTEYQLEHDQGGSETLAASNSYSWGQLTNGTEYSFRLRARNEAGWGEFSGWSTACRPDIEPEQPAPPQVVHGNRVLNVSWSPPTNDGSDITGYEVRIGGGAPQPVAGDVLAFPWEGLTNGEAHTFQVRAQNLAGWSPWSAPSEPEFPSTTPSAPTIGAVGRAGLIGNAASGILDVSWGRVAFPENGGAVVERYEVELVGGGSPVLVAGENNTNYIWSGLTNGVAHRFRVRAVNRDGVSPWSAESEELQACTVPGAPNGLSATRGDRLASVSFSAPDFDGGCSITQYNIRIAGSQSQGTTVSGTGSHNMTGLTNGTSYAFEIAATNQIGQGPWVQTNTVVPAGLPICSNGLTIGTRAHNSVNLSWNSANFNGASPQGYEVRLNTGNWAFISNGTSANYSGLSENTTYQFAVRARNDIGASQTCGTQSGVTTCGRPPQPATPNLSANQANNSVTGTWSTVGNLNGCGSTYNVTRYEVKLLNNANQNSNLNTSRTWSNLDPGDYRFRVRGCNTLGCGAWSNFSAFRTIEPDRIVILSQGDRRVRNGCVNGPCDDLVVTLTGWLPNEQVTITSQASDSPNNWCGNWTVTVNGNGDGTFDEQCHYGFWGEQVWVFANGIQSPSITWTQ